MDKNLKQLINILNLQVEFYRDGLQTGEELKKNIKEILVFHFRSKVLKIKK